MGLKTSFIFIPPMEWHVIQINEYLSIPDINFIAQPKSGISGKITPLILG